MTARILALLAASLLATACKTVRYRTGAPAGGQVVERTARFYVLGAVGTETIDLTEACPQGVSGWLNKKSFTDGFFTFVTLGIYTPRTIVIDCAPKEQAR